MPKFTEIRPLFRLKLDSQPVSAFLHKYPAHTIGKPESGRQHVSFKSLGFGFAFQPLSGPQGGPSKHLRVLTTVFLYREGHENFRAFAEPPFGILFDSSAQELETQLGPPTWTNLPTGVKSILGLCYGSRWMIDDLDVFADFDPVDMTIQLLVISVPEVRPG